VEASYSLSLGEQRLILVAISKINPLESLPDKPIRIYAKEYEEFYAKAGVSIKNAYSVLQASSKDLYERSIIELKGTKKRKTRWVYSICYEPFDGFIELTFSPSLAPYLTNLSKQFMSVTQQQLSGLKSLYTIRLLEMLMQWKTTGSLKISVADFKERLQISEKYPRWDNLKNRVLLPAIKELKKNCDLDVEMKLLRKGRSITAIEFVFQEVAQQSLPL